MPAQKFETVDEYIAALPDDVQVVAQEVRRTIRQAVPGVGETIRYQIPTMTLDGASLVHFAAWKHHLSLYPVPNGDEAFERDVAPYRAAKAAMRIPFGQPLPVDVIERLVAMLVERHEGE